MSDDSPRPSAPFAGLEWLRVVASLGIVAFHQHAPGDRIGHAGLAVFAALTAAMAARSARGRDWAAFRGGRLRRMLLPWLVWSAFYALVQVALAQFGGQPWWARFEPTMLVTGTYPHLWYLPFAAVAALLAGRCGARGPAAAWLLAGAVTMPVASWLLTLPMPLPALNWSFVAPAALLGVGLARTPLGGGWHAIPWGFAGAGALGWLACLVLGQADLLPEYPIAVGTVTVAWALPWRAGAWTTRLAATTFGIYVLHMFVDLLVALLAVQGWATFTVWTRLAAAFGGALLLTWTLRATRVRAVL